MKLLTIVGVVLVVLGIAGLFFGGITWTKHSDRTDLGLFQVTLQDKQHLAIHPAIGGVLLAAGGVVIWAGRRSR